MDRSAIPLNFGLDFQANAAIVLMLDNMKELSSIRVECNEDIDIELNDGTYVLAQAKSVINSSTDYNNVRANAKKAMVSLSDGAQKVRVKKLVYITNSPNPFNDDVSKNMFYGPSIVRYSELPVTAKNLIDGYLSQITHPLDTNRLIIRVIPFEGDDVRQRYKAICEDIQDFIEGLNVNETAFRKKLHSVWSEMLYMSGTKKDKGIKLGKKDVVWPIIVCAVGQGRLDRTSLYCENLDDGEFEEIHYKYAEIIDYSSERYELVAKVIADYSKSGLKGRNSIALFINQHWADYKDEMGLEPIDEDILPSLIKIVLYTILLKRYTINQISKAVNL